MAHTAYSCDPQFCPALGDGKMPETCEVCAASPKL